MRYKTIFIALWALAATAPIVNAYPWEPIVGIPQPSFGLDDPPALPSSWTSEVAGFYFVAASGGSDSGRTYGTPTAPRATLPTSPAAGSVICLGAGTRSGNYTFSWTNGTTAQPIWVRSYDLNNRAVFGNGDWSVTGDNIYFYGINQSRTDNTLVEVSGSYITFRNCTFANTYGSSNGTLFFPSGTYLLVDGCTFGPSGNWQYTGSDTDRHGVKDMDGSYHWFVRSTFKNIQGDGIQWGDYTGPGSRYTYIGKNVAYQNLQSGFWAKNGSDLIVSSNVVYGMSRTTDSGPGAGMGAQYSNQYVWFLCNEIYSSNAGVMIQGEETGASNLYIIGNVIHDTTLPDGFSATNPHNGHAITIRYASVNVQCLFNTIWDCHAGIATPYGGHTFKYNVIGPSTSSGGSQLFVENATNTTVDYNYFAGASPTIRWDSSSTAAWSTYTAQDKHAGNNVTAAAFSNASADVYSLASGSALIDKGGTGTISAFATFQSRYGIDIAKDVANTARPQGSAYDVGAFEHTGGQSTTPPNDPTGLQLSGG